MNFSNRWRLNTAWIIAVLILIFMTVYFEPTSKEFLGVVSSDEVISSSKSGGRIKQMLVASGEEVTKGDLLVELENISLQLEINQAEYELDSLVAQLKINRTLNGEKKNSQDESDPIYLKIKQLKKDLELRYQKRDSLKIYAVSDGIVGGIFAKEGQYVGPYQNVISTYNANVELVSGFIHEDGVMDLKLYDEVSVASASNPKNMVVAKIENLGKRIIEFPDRLKKTQTVKTWGREVLIRLPSNHSFLASEKVVIRRKILTGSRFKEAVSTAKK